VKASEVEETARETVEVEEGATATLRAEIDGRSPGREYRLMR